MQVSLEQARSMAEAAAKDYFAYVVKNAPAKWLRDDVLEAANGWLFLRDDSVELTEVGKLRDAAFIIGRNGRRITVADHDRDVEKLRGYLVKVSDALGGHGA